MNFKISILLSIGLIIGCTQSVTPEKKSKWITPLETVCEKSGGKIDANGCKNNWFGGSMICSESGGRLPTLDELTNEIVSCQGIVTQSNRGIGEMLQNIGNHSYQKCYKNNGFNSVTYWSSSTISRFHPLAIYVEFKGGLKGALPKASPRYITCVKR